MSRYALPNHDATLAVIVGWDNPLQTFFGQVMRPASTPTADDECVVWVGNELREIATVADLCTRLHLYATIPVALQAQLTRDQASSLPPSALQRRMVELLAQLEQETGGVRWCHI